MRKLLLVFTTCALLLVLVMPTALTFAQEDEMPVCTEAEITQVAEGIDLYSQAIAELGDISTDPTEGAYGLVLIGYDAFSYEFWNTVYPEVPMCTEAQALAFAFGTFYDELALAASFANIAGWAESLGEAEAAEYFAQSATYRTDGINAMLEEMQGMSAADLVGETSPACTEEEYEANSTAIEGYFSAIDEAQVELESLSSSDLETLVATVVTYDLFAQAYWDEVYPILPACAEAEYDAYIAGSVIDQILMVTTLYLNAALETEGGNAEIAEVLAASADARSEDLYTFLEMMEE